MFIFVNLSIIIKNAGPAEGQITPKKSRTPLVEILLFYLKIPRNHFVLGKISYAIRKRELPLGADETYFKVEGPKNQGYERF